MDQDSLFKIGFVAKAHGLKGEVTLTITPDCPDLASLHSVFLLVKSSLVPYFIESFSAKGSKAFVKFEDVDSPEAASLLKGSSVFLPRTERPKLTKGEFYDDEVIGFEVSDSAKGILGTVNDVETAGSSRFLVLFYNGKDVLIPTNGPFIKSLNKSKKKISVELPDGFLDI